MAIVKSSLLSRVSPGLLGEEMANSALPHLTDEEMITAESEIAEAQDQSMELQQTLQAIEDMQNVQEELAGQVAQNEVNLAAIQGQEVPAEGSEMTISNDTPVVNDDGSTSASGEVVTQVPAPAPELDQNSSPEAIVDKTMELEGAMEAISGILTGSRLRSRDGLYAQLGIRQSSFGTESALKDPLAAYKESCEGIKEAFGVLGARIKAHIKNAANKVGRMIHTHNAMWSHIFSAFRHIVSRVHKMNPEDYEVKEGKRVSQDVIMFTYNKGKGAISGRIEAIDNVLSTFAKFQKQLGDVSITETAYCKNFKNEIINKGLVTLPEGESLDDVVLIPRNGRSVLCVNKTTFKTRSLSLNKVDNVVEELSGPERVAMAKEIAADVSRSGQQSKRVLALAEKGIGGFFDPATSIGSVNRASGTKTLTDDEGNEKQVSESYDNNNKISNIIGSYMNVSAALVDIYPQAVSSYKSLLGSVKPNQAKLDEAAQAEVEELKKQAEEAIAHVQAEKQR